MSQVTQNLFDLVTYSEETHAIAIASITKMVREINRSHEQLKRIGSYLWKDLSVALGEEVQKKNIRGTMERYLESQENNGDRCCFCRVKTRSL